MIKLSSICTLEAVPSVRRESASTKASRQSFFAPGDIAAFAKPMQLLGLNREDPRARLN